MRNNLKANVQQLAKKQKGFTLVEIAIVLVIIGLLLGGVLKGQELIENTKIKSVKTDTDAIQAAILGYQDRFRALPGDDESASSRGASADGDGDGLIEAAEETDVWESLRSEGFMSGSGTTAPKNGFGGDVTLGTSTSATAGEGGLVICHAGLTIDQMTLVDTSFDDGTATTGTIFGAADTATAIAGTEKAFTAGELLCIRY